MLVLVYVGAIVVLVLFALMLTRAPIGPDRAHEVPWWRRVLAALAGAATSALLLIALLPLAGDAVERREVTNAAVATELFGTWVWPFEALSVLLLAALVAALAVSRSGRDRSSTDRPLARLGHVVPAEGRSDVSQTGNKSKHGGAS
ncbi:hypothetical protein GCM10011314_12560 [Knoellia flava]|uniref:NADH-quinone oxidoreductase subunit J n=1 Tax=Knoellia flava TaxID=913969 RepID=A0A8H9FRA3_9MICO|nr:hypothetical protein GCM10011314_12560 [Knoellia flava]